MGYKQTLVFVYKSIYGRKNCISSIIFLSWSFYFISFFKRFYLFNFRERRREGKRGGEKQPCVTGTFISYLSYSPRGGPGLQSRHVPWLGIKPATFLFAGLHSIHWATPARGIFLFCFKTVLYSMNLQQCYRVNEQAANMWNLEAE